MIVKKGKHRFKPPTLGLFFSRKMSRVLVFTDSCIYNLNSFDQLDINKLFGVGYFPNHHRNSARFGWRWNLSSQMIELFAYNYVNSERQITYLDSVSINEEVHLSIELQKNKYIFKVNSNIWEFTGKTYWIGYKLGAYFGGNKPAPHNMIIKRK